MEEVATTKQPIKLRKRNKVNKKKRKNEIKFKKNVKLKGKKPNAVEKAATKSHESDSNNIFV